MDEDASHGRNDQSVRSTLGIGENIIESVRTPLLVLRENLCVETANRSFCSTFQVSKETTEGRCLFEIGSGEWDIPELRRLLPEILPENLSLDDFEVEQGFRGIGRRTVLLNASRLTQEEGDADFILLAVEDVTEQRRAERAIQEAKQFTKQIVDTVQHSLLVLDADLRVQAANDAFYHAFQVSPEETEGRLVYDLGNGQWEIPELHNLLTEILPQNTSFSDFDVEHEFASLGQRSMRLNARRLLLDGNRSESIVLAIEDVTEQKRAEEERQELETRFISLVKNIREHSIFTLDPAGCITSWNLEADMTERQQAHEALLKQSEQLRTLLDAAEVLLTAPDPKVMMQEIFCGVSEHLAVDAYFNFVVGESGDHLRLVACGGVPKDFASSIERLEFGQAVCGTVAVIRKPIIATNIQQSDDAKTALVKGFGIRTYVCHPLIFEDDFLGTLSFASRRVDAFDEEELAFLKTLCHYVTVAYARLRLVEELQNAHRRKDEFLAMLAHELRNPLAPIRSGLDVLAMEETGHSKTVEMMQAQLSHVVRLVDDLLDISRIMRERVDLRREPVELSSLVQQSVAAVRPSIDRHQQKLSVCLPEEPISINADSVRVVQVIENLLNNATKYTGVGGQIELIVERKDAMASITVRDSGVGIDPDLLPNIFELFTQSDRSLDRSQGGLGIGLTLVKRLVELHGGTVSAHSEGPGCGSTFAVQFPTIEPVAPTKDIIEPVPSAAGRRIVVVDDNKGAAWMLSMLLKKLGDHEIESAHDGPSALKTITEFVPEIVFLDIGLPGMDGHEVARAVRKMPAFGDMLLIALTGYGQEEDRRKSKEAGFDEHLTKPPSLDQMMAILAHPKLSQAKR